MKYIIFFAHLKKKKLFEEWKDFWIFLSIFFFFFINSKIFLKKNFYNKKYYYNEWKRKQKCKFKIAFAKFKVYVYYSNSEYQYVAPTFEQHWYLRRISNISFSSFLFPSVLISNNKIILDRNCLNIKPTLCLIF